MKVDTLVASVVINPCDAGSRNLQFNLFNPAAIKQRIGEQQQEAAAAAGFTRLRSLSEKVHSETHGQNWAAAETLVYPFTVAPAHPGNIADNSEKCDRNKNPLLFTTIQSKKCIADSMKLVRF